MARCALSFFVDSRAGCSSCFLDLLRLHSEDGILGQHSDYVSSLAAGASVFIPGPNAGGKQAAVRPQSMLCASVEDVRALAKNAGWILGEPDKPYGNERWQHPQNANRGVLRIVEGGVPNVDDTSGAHSGTYMEMSSGGIRYHVALEDNPALSDPNLPGHYEATPGAKGDPNLSRPYPPADEFGGEVPGE
jgi:hypothetical protein